MSGALVAGDPAAVAVATGTLWAAPDRVRPVDKPAVETPSDVRAWAGMTVAEEKDLRGRTLSQLLLGDVVRVEKVHGDWARVIAPGQPAGADPRGYPGWIPVAQLAPADDRTPTHIVDVPVTALYDGDGGIAVADVGLGTRLCVTGPVEGGRLPVAVPGRGTSLRIPADAVAPLSGPVPEVLRVAESLLGTRYVWGGLSSFGIDCSGLVHLSFRRLGVTVPRDAADQAGATTPIDFGTERPGDVYFFAEPGRRIHHVGFVDRVPDPDGTRYMLHACGSGQAVLRQPVVGERLDTLVSVHRVG
jgi:gamma-D-glutamyl-L-lysine dipeptidyl-peptidase